MQTVTNESRAENNNLLAVSAVLMEIQRSGGRTVCCSCSGVADIDELGDVPFCPDCLERAHASVDDYELGGEQ